MRKTSIDLMFETYREWLLKPADQDKPIHHRYYAGPDRWRTRMVIPGSRKLVQEVGAMYARHIFEKPTIPGAEEP